MHPLGTFRAVLPLDRRGYIVHIKIDGIVTTKHLARPPDTRAVGDHSWHDHFLALPLNVSIISRPVSPNQFRDCHPILVAAPPSFNLHIRLNVNGSLTKPSPATRV